MKSNWTKVLILFSFLFLLIYFVNRRSDQPKSNEKEAAQYSLSSIKPQDNEITPPAKTTESKKPEWKANKPPFSRGENRPNPTHKATLAEAQRFLKKDPNWVKPRKNYRELVSNTSFETNDRSYNILQARAILKKDFSNSLGEVLLEQAGYIIYEPSVPVDTRHLIVSETDRPVIINSVTGRASVLTGTFSVKFKDFRFAKNVAAKERLQILHLDSTISVAHFKAPEGVDLLTLQKKLLQNSTVSEVEIDFAMSVGNTQ